MTFPIDLTALAGAASDILLAIGALGAGIYCLVLSRRLRRFNNLENGVGGAVAVLSAQVDDMTKTLEKARKAAMQSSVTLTELTDRAESAARKLELMMASLHDLPEAPATPAARERAMDDTWRDAEEAGVRFSTKRRAAEAEA